MYLDHLEEEQLVRLAQRAQDHDVVHTLLLHYWAAILRWVARAARNKCLSPEDVRDGGQQVFFAFLDAVALFDPDQTGRGKRCSFKTFLRLKVRSCIQDYAKSIWRERRHYQHSPGAARQDGATLSHQTAAADDPALAVERTEMLARLHEAVTGLDAEERWMVEQWLRGSSLRAMARKLGQPYHQVKRDWHRIGVQLKAALKDWAP